MGKDYLSKQSSICMKGIFCVFVMLAHIRNKIVILNDTVLGMILTAAGCLSVAVFFFLSGYGLVESHQRNEDYIKRFPKDRLLKFYISYLIAVIIYLVFGCLLGQVKDIEGYTILKSLTFGGTIVANGWYFQSILLFYLAFYFCFRFLRSEKAAFLTISGIVAVYMIINTALRLSPKHYETAAHCEGGFVFIIGMFWAKYRKKINSQPSFKRMVLVGGVSFLVFAVTLLLGNDPQMPELFRVFMKMIYMLSFVIFVLALVYFVPINFSATRFLGKISMEVYIMHGMMIFVWVDYLKIKSAPVFTFAIIVSTMLLALPLNRLNVLISSKIKRES